MTTDERAIEIYKTYIDVICPYILEYELLTNEFPVEILNEIRAIFTHLSKFYLSESDVIKEKNISKAEGHIKRSLLDCYKYLCMVYDDEYKRFEKMYSRIDLSLVDNGEFLPKINESRQRAIVLMKNARKSDLAVDSDDEVNCEEAYKKYEGAFIAYSSVKELLDNSHKKLDYLKKKVVIKDFFSISGWVIGIIGIILTIIAFIF